MYETWNSLQEACLQCHKCGLCEGRHTVVFGIGVELSLIHIFCSCGDTLSVGFSSRYEDTDIQRNFFRLLSGMGVDVEIKSNASVREKD